MNNISCPVYLPSPECNNHGTCNTTIGVCECINGWTSHGDFSNSINGICSISLVTIRILWVLPLMSSLFLLFNCIKLFFMRFSTYKGNQQNQQFWKDPSFVFPFSFLLSSASGVIISSLKISDSQHFSIGFHPAPTFFFTTFFIFGVYGVCAYQYVLINFLQGYADMMSTAVKERMVMQGKLFKRWVNVIAIITAPSCSISFVMLAFPTKDYEIVVAVLATFIFIAGSLVLMIIWYLSMIIMEIEQHLKLKDPSLQQYLAILAVVVKKLIMAKKFMIILGCSSTVAFGVIAIWQLLAKNTSYLWPLQVTSSTTLFLAFVYSIMTDAKKIESSNSRNTNNVNQAEVMPISSGNLMSLSSEGSQDSMA